MTASRPWLPAASLISIVIAVSSSAIMGSTTAASASTDVQLVRISYLQGDVRFNRGDGKQTDLKKPWEHAEVNLPIEQNFALATGDDGRAEIEFESGSVIYVAENSVILFEQIGVRDGAPAARLELVSGTVTAGPAGTSNEFFEIDTPTEQVQINDREGSSVRLDSYLDGMALTPQSDAGWNFASGASTIRILQGQTLTLENGKPIRIDGAGQSKAPHDWDQWADARYRARSATMQAALKASGFSSPIAGLTDLYANGNFSPCPPYGMCWQPSQSVGMPPSVSPQSSGQAPAQASAQTAAKKFTPRLVGFHTSVDECTFSRWYTDWIVARTQHEYEMLSMESQVRDLQEDWRWPLCHYASWIYRNGRYRAVITSNKCREPLHWAKVGKHTGFVPASPADVPGRPPHNLKHGLFVVSGQGTNEVIERVDFHRGDKFELLAGPPKELRRAADPELPRAMPPEIHARLVEDVEPGAKPEGASRNESRITYDYGNRKFVRTGVEVEGHAAKPVVVGSLNARGDFSSASGTGFRGQSGGAGYRGGGTSSNERAGYSGAGRSSGSGASSAARSGGGGSFGGSSGEGGSRGGGSSSGGSSGGGNNSSGSGGHPK
ncbi:MAG: FecR domain-containing protein [Candidatus Acidiferrales bacterium]